MAAWTTKLCSQPKTRAREFSGRIAERDRSNANLMQDVHGNARFPITVLRRGPIDQRVGHGGHIEMAPKITQQLLRADGLFRWA